MCMSVLLAGSFQGIAGGFYGYQTLLSHYFQCIAGSQKKAAGTTLLAVLFPIVRQEQYYEYWKSDSIEDSSS